MSKVKEHKVDIEKATDTIVNRQNNLCKMIEDYKELYNVRHSEIKIIVDTSGSMTM